MWQHARAEKDEHTHAQNITIFVHGYNNDDIFTSTAFIFISHPPHDKTLNPKAGLLASSTI